MTTAYLGLATVPTNTTNPSVPVNDALAAMDSIVAGTVTRNLATDANYTLLRADYLTALLILTDTGLVLTAGRDIVFPAAFPRMYVTNSTAKTLTLKKAGQTGITLAAGATALIYSGVTDVLEFGGGGGAAVTVPIIIACSDEATALTTGTAKVTFRMPYAFTLTGVRASVTTAPTGSVLTVDINESGTTILSTKLTIDATEKTSTTAAAAAVISDTSLADDAEITIDIDAVGSTIAGAGLKVMLIGYKP